MRTKLLIWQRLLVAVLVSAVLLGWTVPVAASPLQQGIVHVVRRGETLTGIAARYGTTVSALVQANNIRNPNWIYVGQRLTIPGTDGNGDDDGDDGGDTPTGVHIVRRGETLSRIAHRYGTTVWAIASLNSLRNINLIYVGQRLLIPGKSGDDPTPPPSPPPPPNPPATGIKKIDIDLSDQLLRAYVGSTEVYRCIVSTGRSPYITVTGQFRIYAKYRYTLMTGPGYYLPNVPHTMYFYRGYAIHGAYWHNNFGTPMSHGCVNLTLPDAEWMYNWAPLNTLVVIHW